MVAAQAHHREEGLPGENEESIATDAKLGDDEKRDLLQRGLTMAASNGDVARIKRLVGGDAKAYVDVNKPDEDGTVPLIYASCFGHAEVVSTLLDAGALVDRQDRNQWSALMWAMTNRHKEIAKTLLDHGANMDIKSSSGGTAYDFVQPGSDFSQYLHENGYHIASGNSGEDFYSSGFDETRFEEELAETAMKRQMLMQESATNLEVDISTLGFDEPPESPTDLDSDEEEFIWERCVGDQMFVFQNSQMDPILDLIITHMTPQRTPSQKPVPANLIFLMARYAHYHMTGSLLGELLEKALDRIGEVIESCQWDMTMLAFWTSNMTLLSHYLKKDAGLIQVTTKFQAELAELINEGFILIIRDAERRMDKIIDAALLDYETIPGLDDIDFQDEWKVFKSKSKTQEEPYEKRFRPPSPKKRAQTSPRNITSLLSSTLFVLDLYDVHSVITAQILAQLLFWIGAELFNRVITTKRYLSRTKAMQIRMNVSMIEDWARANNRQPEHYENGSTISSGESVVDAARRYLSPVIQLLQWLQCFSSLGEDHDSLVATLMQLQRVNPTQLIHAVKHYRPEVGEKSLPKSHMKYLVQLQKGQERLIMRPRTPAPEDASTDPSRTSTPIPVTKAHADTSASATSPNKQQTSAPSIPPPLEPDTDPPENRNTLTLNPAITLPFTLPTSTDMLISYGAGIGGVNRDRARKYVPTVPTDVLAKLNLEGADVSRRASIGTVGTTAQGWRNGG